jgi:phage-related protein
MNEFPRLKTSAVVQYPAQRIVRFSTQVMRFLDGSEQRYREYGSPLRRWVIRLSALDEEEMEALEAFYLSEQGGYGTFSFVDPWDGEEYGNCSLESEDGVFDFTGFHDGRTELVVRQNR